MSEAVTRAVRPVVYLIDIDDEMPGRGQAVLALGVGGKLCETVWSKDSHLFFKAWCHYPAVSKELKTKLYNMYISGEGCK